MAAAGHAAQHGIGREQSAADAVRWYRAALDSRKDSLVSDEVESEAMRLPGGDASELELLSALSALYTSGGADLAPEPRLARQFELLARSCARRSQATETVESDEDMQLFPEREGAEKRQRAWLV
uniref:Uncharacterized protein n=1 Tax=Chrysotila carterae TaxID=13221 RepID=A0A7S4B045_CHRCT